ncbi:MAG TPA: hypothetical protein VF814_04605 [Casimicrobiaceae bacterium]
MPKWVWYAAAAIAAWFLFLRDLLHTTGGANLSVTAGNNTPTAGYSGYPAGYQPPGAPAVTYSSPAPITIGNPSGGTSVAQDIGSVLGGLGQLAGGILGSGGIGGALGRDTSGGVPTGWSTPDW